MLHGKKYTKKKNVYFVCTATKFEENRMIERVFSVLQQVAAADEADEKEDKAEEEDKAAE